VLSHCECRCVITDDLLDYLSTTPIEVELYGAPESLVVDSVIK
jgi:hypothetical protein